MIYSRMCYIDRVEIKSFGRNIEEDATLMQGSLERALDERDDAERFLAAINI